MNWNIYIYLQYIYIYIYIHTLMMVMRVMMMMMMMMMIRSPDLHEFQPTSSPQKMCFKPSDLGAPGDLASCWPCEAWVTFLWGGESERAVKAAILNSEAALSCSWPWHPRVESLR